MTEPNLSAQIVRLDQVDAELKASPGRVTETWAADEVERVIEQLYRVANNLRHGRG